MLPQKADVEKMMYFALTVRQHLGLLSGKIVSRKASCQIRSIILPKNTGDLMVKVEPLLQNTAYTR